MTDKNRDVAEWLGMMKHEWLNPTLDIMGQKRICCNRCGKLAFDEIDQSDCGGAKYPDFTTAPGKELLLIEMKKKNLLAKFIVSLLLENGYGSIEHADVIPIKYITDITGKLLDAVWEFKEMEGRKEEGMKPIKFPECNSVFAKDQPEYLPLPAYICPNDMRGQIVICWSLTFRERITLLFTGKLWHSVFTFYKPLQPMKIQVEKFDGSYPMCGEKEKGEER